MQTKAKPIYKIRIGEKAISTLVCLLLLQCSCNSSSIQSAQRSRYEVVYRCMESSASPRVEISLILDRNELATKLKELVTEMYDRWPSGVSPNLPRLPADVVTEELIINRRGGPTIKFELLPISPEVFDSMSEDGQLARKMFGAVREELLQVIASLANPRAQSVPSAN